LGSGGADADPIKASPPIIDPTFPEKFFSPNVLVLLLARKMIHSNG
jgi:hypothetical protein